MKNLFEICLMLSLLSGLASCNSIVQKQRDPFAIHVDSTNQYIPNHFVTDAKPVMIINALAKEVQRVDSVSFGLCDTCATGYRAAILENQLLAERLARESYKLREKLQLMNEQIMKINQLLDHTDQKSRELASIKKKLGDEIEIQLVELKNAKSPPMYVKK